MKKTPQEKAKELADKFYQTTPIESWYNPPISSVKIKEYKAWEQAKECALISVKEILVIMNEEYLSGAEKIEYWEKVKQELEKL
jgi:hypothetical protein